MERGPLCLPGEDDAVRVIAHDFPAGKGNMGRKSLAEAVGGWSGQEFSASSLYSVAATFLGSVMEQMGWRSPAALGRAKQ